MIQYERNHYTVRQRLLLVLGSRYLYNSATRLTRPVWHGSTQSSTASFSSSASPHEPWISPLLLASLCFPVTWRNLAGSFYAVVHVIAALTLLLFASFPADFLGPSVNTTLKAGVSTADVGGNPIDNNQDAQLWEWLRLSPDAPEDLTASQKSAK